jgi:hypothetical protein
MLCGPLDPVFVRRVAEGLELDSDRIELIEQRRSTDPTLHQIAMALRGESRAALQLTACMGRHYQPRSPFKPSFVCSESSFLPKNRSKLQVNQNVFNESLPDL